MSSQLQLQYASLHADRESDCPALGDQLGIPAKDRGHCL